MLCNDSYRRSPQCENYAIFNRNEYDIISYVLHVLDRFEMTTMFYKDKKIDF